ncbi:flagellin N-terminal helical domain-containing protein [Kosakonia cowanii]|uniref:flagellin N-terminal helical domain-containing protein n=1 Tax=Kosakonia cowanii TaxID=208223 RepID=UPI004062828B
MAVINTNTLSLINQNNLSKSQAAQSSAIQRLSSGLRINSAKDDAAGQAIANRFSSSISGMGVAARNANDAISLAQTAEGALSEINNNLQRIRDLAVQAQNSSNSASDIDSIQSEVNERMAEINRVTLQTDFNGIKILNTGSGASSYSFHVGTDDGEEIVIRMSSSDDYNLGANSGSIGEVSGEFIHGSARSVKAIGFDVLHGEVTPASGAISNKPLAAIDEAIKAVDTQRSALGAFQNRFESVINNLNQAANNLSAARSRISDADYGTEVSNMSRAQILQQAGSSVLAQANQVPQTMLSLLR